MSAKIVFTIATTILFFDGARSQQIIEKNYAKFEVENGGISWIRVYERATITKDSIKGIIYSNLKKDNTLQLINENENEITLQMTDKVFEKNGDKFSGRIIIDLKNEKYRVTLSSITRNYGIKTLRTANFVGGSMMAKRLTDANGVRFEDDYVNKSNDGIKDTSAVKRTLDFYNKLFFTGFDFKFMSSTKNDDW